MARIRFKYNPKKLVYERETISLGGVLLRGVAYVLAGCGCFVALLAAQNRLIDTPRERQLRAENQALKHHQARLTSLHEQAQKKLADLRQHEDEFTSLLFETAPTAPPRTRKWAQDEMLFADAAEYDQWVEQLQTGVRDLFHTAAWKNDDHAERLALSREEIRQLTTLPTHLPFAGFEADMLVCGFGARIQPFHKRKYFHAGLDFRAPRGTPVLATGPGTVVAAKTSELVAGYGNYVEIDHGGGLVTRYAHLEKLTVKQGQRIKAGDEIGTVGSSGGSSAPHLHYEVLQHGKPVDPVPYFTVALTPVAYNRLVQLSKKETQSLD